MAVCRNAVAVRRTNMRMITSCNSMAREVASWGRRTLFGSFALSMLVVLAPVSWAQTKPCCTITGLDATAATATAREDSTGRTFVFKVAEARLFASLRVGQD